MALNSKKPAFGLDVEGRLKRPAATDTDTYTHEYEHTDTAKPETRSKRTYGMIQPSIFEKVTAYAKAHNTSYNDIVVKLLEDFVKDNNL